MLRSLFAATAVSLLALPSLVLAAPDPAPPPVADNPADAAAAPAVPPAERMPVPNGPVPALPPPEPVAPATAFRWEPFGYLRMEYIAIQDDPNVAYVGRNDGFYMQNARVGARGQLNDRIAFVASIDGAVDERTQINNPQGNLAVGIRDTYADVRVAGAPQSQLVVRGGYFVPWSDPEALVPDTSRAFIDKPIEDRGVTATEGYETPGLTPGHAMGVALRLDPQVPTSGIRAGFEIAAQNGADEFASTNDNDNLAFSVAGIVRFPHDGWLVAAVRYNPRTIGDLPFRQDETDEQASFGLRVVLGPAAIMGGLFLQNTTFPTTGGPSQNSYGGHAQIMIRLTDRIPLAIGYRFDVLDPSSLVTTDRVMENTAAAVLGVPSLRMRFQLQLVDVEEQAQRQLSNDRIQLAAEVAL